MGWATHVLQRRAQGGANMQVRVNLRKTRRSSDCFLKLENMKLESQVIVKQKVTVNMFLDFVHTARHAMEVCYDSKFANF